MSFLSRILHTTMGLPEINLAHIGGHGGGATVDLPDNVIAAIENASTEELTRLTSHLNLQEAALLGKAGTVIAAAAAARVQELAGSAPPAPIPVVPSFAPLDAGTSSG